MNKSRRIQTGMALILLFAASLACNAPGGGAATDVPLPTEAAGVTAAPPATAAVEVEPTEPAAEPTGAPTEAPPAARQVIVHTADNTLVSVDSLSGAITPIASLSFDFYPGPHTVAGMSGGVFYLRDTFSKIYEVSGAGSVELGFVTAAGGGQVQGVAVWPGSADEAPRIAWTVYDISGGPGHYISKLYIASLDGSDLTLAEEINTPEGWYLAPERWSEDGQRLYYSAEPMGLGGYILFGGDSSLYVYNMADGSKQPLVPKEEMNIICLDDLSADETLVALTCSTVEIVNVSTGATWLIPTPGGVDFGQMGSARFSPDGSRLAFGLARGEYENEQGWLAVSDDLHSSHVIATADPGAWYQPAAWLDDETLLIQRNSPDFTSLWVVPADGSAAPVWLADGQFVMLVP